jgi:uncharacterized protein YndB with AHSA1/START domain
MEQKDKADQVRIIQIFEAPVEKVFDAWTKQEHLEQWYAPDNCSIFFKNISITEGGQFLYCITNPIFGECWCKGTFLQIARPKLLSYSVIISDEFGNDVLPEDAGMDADWPMESVVTVKFTGSNGKTKIELTQSVLTKVAKRTGAYPSWIQMLEKLKLKTEMTQLKQNLL